MHWWEDHYTLIEVARFIDETNGFIDADEAIAFFEKPWKSQGMYHRWAEREILDQLAVSEEHHA